MIMSRKFFFILILLSFAFLVPTVSRAAEVIRDFALTAQINTDASVDFSERITYDFGMAQKHGIFRYIPVRYKARGGNFNYRVSNISVVDEKGSAYSYTTSNPGDNLEIKIGDPDRLISGTKVYVIRYSIKRAINYFSEHDELYWNVTGNGWPVAIDHATAEVILPTSSGREAVVTECFAGPFGSISKCTRQEKLGTTDQVSVAKFEQGPMSIGSGLTFAVAFPKGLVHQPSAIENTLEAIKDNWILFMPLLALILGGFTWWKFGRDPKGRGTIIAEFEAPDKLTPAEVGAIMRFGPNNNDISAEIVYLATKGYLRIVRYERKTLMFGTPDYLLVKVKEADASLSAANKDLLDSLFGSANLYVKSSASVFPDFLVGKDEAVEAMITSGKVVGDIVRLSDLKEKFHVHMQRVKDSVKDDMEKRGYFSAAGDRWKKYYFGIAIVMIAVPFFLANVIGGIVIFSTVTSAAIVLVFGMIMDARSAKGVEAKEKILGLKLYLSVAEKDRIAFHNAPEKSPERFEKLLPYAMVLGVEKEWAKQFEDIYKQPGSWYTDSTGAGFNSMVFASNLGSFASAAGSTMSSAPGGGSGVGGGGSSGGGGGGGGGGSW